MVSLGNLGTLIITLKGEGVKETAKDIQEVKKHYTDTAKSARKNIPVIEKWTRRWGSVITLLGASAGITFGLIAANSPSMMGALGGMKEAFESIFFVVGEQLSPIFMALTDIMLGITDAFLGLPEPAQTFISFIIGMVAALGALGGAILTGVALWGTFGGALAGIIPVITGLLGPIGLIIGILALLYTAWVHNWFGIRDKTKATLHAIKEIIKLAMTGVKMFMSDVWRAIKQGVSSVWTSIKNIVSAGANFVVSKTRAMLDRVLSIVARIKAAWASVKGAVGGAIETGRSVVGRVLGSRQSGGYIPRTGPYLLHEGETVVPATGAGGLGNIEIRNVVELDGRQIWEGVKRYGANDLRRLGG